MKTTVEMSDHLMTELKIIAAREHRRLRDVMEEIVSLGLRVRREEAVPEHEAEAAAQEWLSAWSALGREVEESSVDPRSCVDILLDDRR